MRNVVEINSVEEMFEEGKKYNPRVFKSEIMGRGPLDVNWVKTTKPVSYTFRLVDLSFDCWDALIPSKLESYVTDTTAKLLWKYGRQMFCTMDDWINITVENIRIMEKECAENVEKEMMKETKEEATSLC